MRSTGKHFFMIFWENYGNKILIAFGHLLQTKARNSLPLSPLPHPPTFFLLYTSLKEFSSSLDKGETLQTAN